MATIYFNDKKIQQNANEYLKAADVPAHEKIGLLYARARGSLSSKDQNTMSSILSHLRLNANDTTAVATMSPLLHRLADGSLKIVPSDNSGIFFLKAPSSEEKDRFEDVAVFKIGRKRACIETMARQFAHWLGLEKQMAPGMFCAIENLTLSGSDEDEAVEDLWNGHQKIYLSPLTQTSNNSSTTSKASEDSSAEKIAAVVVGIVQPFLKKEPVAPLCDYMLMTILALAIGLRDGKNSSYEGSTLFDVEDCMPLRIDPVWEPEKIEEAPSAIELLYLDKDPRTNQQLSPDEVRKLASLVQQWDILKIVNNLQGLSIRYEDHRGESFKMEETGFDEGGHRIKVEKGRVHLINGHLNHLHSSNPKRSILLQEQLNSCNTRLQRIRDFIMLYARRQATFTPQQLVHAVDLYGKFFQEAILSSPLLPPLYERTRYREGVNAISGRISPKKLKISLPPNDFPSSSEIIDKLKKASPEEEKKS